MSKKIPLKYTIELIKEMIDACTNSDFQLLSTKYPNELGYKVLVKCNNCGREVKRSPCDFRPEASYGCRCNNKTIYTIEKIQGMIDSSEKNNLTLLSTSYPNELGYNVSVMCNECNYVYTTSPYRLTPGNERECRKCFMDKFASNKRLSIDEVKDRLKKLGFELIDEVYINNSLPLKLKCNYGHIFENSLAYVLDGTQCPKCKPGVAGKTEEICRIIFESLLDKKFPKVSPKWLINTDGNRLQFDGYCKELNLAFEYNGRQHYKYVEHFHRTYENFIKRCSDDVDKRKICEKMKVRLITIHHRIKTFNLETLIRLELHRLGIKIQNNNTVKLDTNFKNSFVEERNKLVDQKLTKTKYKRIGSYIKCNTSITLECKDCKTHREATYEHIMLYKYTTCENCTTNKRIDDKLKNTLFKRISDYTKFKNPIILECRNCGYRRQTTYRAIVHPKCKYQTCPNCTN